MKESHTGTGVGGREIVFWHTFIASVTGAGLAGASSEASYKVSFEIAQNTYVRSHDR